CDARLPFNDLLELALPADYDLISSLIQSFQRQESAGGNLATLSFSLPHRFAAAGRNVFPLIDCLGLRPFRDELATAHELVSSIERAGGPFVLAGLRRQVSDLIHGFEDDGAHHNILHVDRLCDED